MLIEVPLVIQRETGEIHAKNGFTKEEEREKKVWKKKNCRKGINGYS